MTSNLGSHVDRRRGGAGGLRPRRRHAAAGDGRAARALPAGVPQPDRRRSSSSTRSAASTWRRSSTSSCAACCGGSRSGRSTWTLTDRARQHAGGRGIRPDVRRTAAEADAPAAAARSARARGSAGPVPRRATAWSSTRDRRLTFSTREPIGALVAPIKKPRLPKPAGDGPVNAVHSDRAPSRRCGTCSGSSSCWPSCRPTCSCPRAAPIWYSEFKALLAQDKVAEVTINDQVVRGQLKPRRQDEKSRAFVATRVDDPKLVEELEQHNVKFTGEVASRWLPELLGWILPLLLRSSACPASSSAAWAAGGRRDVVRAAARRSTPKTTSR